MLKIVCLFLLVEACNELKLSWPGVFRHLQAVTLLLPHTPTYLPQAQPNQYIISQSLHSPLTLSIQKTSPPSYSTLTLSPLTFHTISCCFLPLPLLSFLSSSSLWPPPTHSCSFSALLSFVHFFLNPPLMCWMVQTRGKNGRWWGVNVGWVGDLCCIR